MKTITTTWTWVGIHRAALVLAWAVLGTASGFALTPAGLTNGHTLKLLTQVGYLPEVPVLVRVEVWGTNGLPERELWDAEATLTANAGVSLSTNRVPLRNGLGSVLVTCAGGGDFNLTATVGSLSTGKAMVTLSGVPVTEVSGTLGETRPVWSGVIRVNGDVTVPAGTQLTILSNTLVLVDGAASGTVAGDLFIRGSIHSLGTEEQPVTITCAVAGQRWGQIRHDTAGPSVYRYTTISRAGRAPGEGHTGTAPVIRSTGSTLVFEGCSITDLAEGDASGAGFGGPGKIGQATGSDWVFSHCLLQRARMGPEITGTALLCTNTWIMDMAGPDDSDGFYIHDQAAGQQVLFAGCVVANGDDDGLDTLGSIITVEDCILREWDNRLEDAKAISVFNGTTTVRRSLIVDSTVGIAAKWSGGAGTVVNIDHCTLHANLTNLWANRKDNAPGPFVDFRVTNSVLWGTPTPIQSDFAETNFTVRYSLVSPAWPGLGNVAADPLFTDAAAHDFHLQPFSPAIDAGHPSWPADPDGSRTDMGARIFSAPRPVLETPRLTSGGAFEFVLTAYPNRDYVIETSVALPDWTVLRTNLQTAPSVSVTPLPPPVEAQRYFRARAIYSPLGPPPEPPGPVTIALLAYGDSWRYQQAANLDGANWTAPLYDDATWPSGAGVLAVGGSGTIAVPIQTPLTLGRLTYYFRTRFTLPAGITVTNLAGTHIVDDGAVVYLNGQEAYRYNMGTTNLTYASLAASNISGAPAERAFALPVNLLVPGENVLAVEVHQATAGSSDIYLGLRLNGLVSTNSF